MKATLQILLLGATATAAVAQSDPRLSTWYTAKSGEYARIFTTRENEQAGNAVTTWDNGTYAQSQPVYGGVLGVSYSTDFVYVRTAGLALGHVMGPWYNNTGPGGTEEVFQNWPEAIYANYRFPRTPVIPTQRTSFPPGAIGLMIDGTIIFSSSDTFSWDNNEDGTGNGTDTGPGVQGAGMGDGIWSHDAYITESNTFDKSNAHAAGNQLHYHAAPMKLRHALGDSVQALQQANGEFLYSENFNGNHSPVIGWMNDGYPLYGPYGYNSPMDPNSGVRRMVTGFLVRNGQNGTYDIPTNGRNQLPEWAVRFQGIGASLTVNQQGPTHAAIPVPYYMEDYDFKGDVTGYSYYDGTGTFSENTHYDLNELNVRFCVTPEFPNGTWAYFTCIDDQGRPTFPYNVSVQYWGDPSQGGAVTTITENVTTNWVGGPDAPLQVAAPSRNAGNVTLTWSAVEGGTYTVQATDALTDAPSWSPIATGVAANLSTGMATDSTTSDNRFFRVSRTALAAYDSVGSTTGTGGGNTGGNNGAPTLASVSPNSGEEGATVTVTITLNGTMLPPSGATPSSVMIGSVTGTSVSYNGSAVTASFTFPGGTTGPQNVTVAFPAPNAQTPALNITGNGAFTLTAAAGTGGGTPGGNGILSASPNVANRGTTLTLTINLDPGANPPLPMTGGPGPAPMPTVTIGGTQASSAAYSGTVVTATVAIPVGATPGPAEIVVSFPPPPGMQNGPSYNLTGGFTVN
jgi:hypothetical protein